MAGSLDRGFQDETIDLLITPVVRMPHVRPEQAGDILILLFPDVRPRPRPRRVGDAAELPVADRRNVARHRLQLRLEPLHDGLRRPVESAQQKDAKDTARQVRLPHPGPAS